MQVRRLAYTVFSLDTFLRTTHVRATGHEEAALVRAMQAAAQVMHDELRRCALLILASPRRGRPEADTEGADRGQPLAHSDSALLRPAAAAEAASTTLAAVVAPLNAALDEYVRTSTCAHLSVATDAGHDDERQADLQGPANHIAFAKLMLLTIARVEAILLTTAQLAAQRRGRAHGAPPPLAPRESGASQQNGNHHAEHEDILM